MFDFNHYVPILKGKRGEFGAINNLSKSAKSKITPLIDFPRISPYPLDKPKESLEVHLGKVINNLFKAWGSDSPVFIDIYNIELSARTSDMEHPIGYIFNLLRKLSIQGIPTIGLDRDDAFRNSIKKVISRDKRGVCIRLLSDDLLSLDELNSDLDNLLKLLKVSKRDTHLLFDLRALQNPDLDRLAKKLIRIINGIKDISQWQTIILAASGYPDSLSGISSNKISRVEHKLWKLITSMSSIIERVPSFGDYGIVNPDFVDIDPRVLNPSAKIRYTLNGHWLILKGGSLKKHPDKFKQYHSLAQKLISRKEFMDASYSYGDNYIAKCANMRVKSGNLETWVTVDTNHHLTFVSEQIANTVLT